MSATPPQSNQTVEQNSSSQYGTVVIPIEPSSSTHIGSSDVDHKSADERQRLLSHDARMDSAHAIIGIGKSSSASLKPNETGGSPRCRICSGSSDKEDSELGSLISPCRCKGTARYIHLGCLRRATSTTKESSFRCDTCQYQYSLSRLWKAKILGFWGLPYITASIVYLALFYVLALVGRILNDQKVWEWKQLLKDHLKGPLTSVMGVDWTDLAWGASIIAIIGIFVISFAVFTDRCIAACGGTRRAPVGDCASCCSHYLYWALKIVFLPVFMVVG
ncbi:hypothetical protein BGZ65_000065, partial [Modicella reniformis]